jgi:hypothetical protein
VPRSLTQKLQVLAMATVLKVKGVDAMKGGNLNSNYRLHTRSFCSVVEVVP